jgi:hypothetical protein
MKIHQLIYTSRATSNLTEAELISMLVNAQRINYEHKLTGILIFQNNEIMQLIEGEHNNVKKIFAKIRNDTRHTDVKIVLEADSPSRSFPMWVMGACFVDSKSTENSKEGLHLSIDEVRKICLELDGEVGQMLTKFIGST